MFHQGLFCPIQCDKESDYKKFDTNIKNADVSNHLIYNIKNDATLWVGLNEDNNFYSPEKVQALSVPLKLTDGIREATCVDPYIFAVSNEGELLVCHINTMESTPVSTVPKKNYGRC